jgi:mannose-6-phosphate isomerase-like protein (cupin superfamily)
MKRIVTGHRNGKSVILDEKEIPAQPIIVGEVFRLWATSSLPSIPMNERESQKQIREELPTKPGETYFSITVIEPDKVVLNKNKEKGIDQSEFWRKIFNDDYGMHTTNTIDYDIVLSGELWMEVDDGVEVYLKAGDCIIQNGTRHAWRNKNSTNCILASVMIGTKKAV